jgi:protein SCO1
VALPVRRALLWGLLVVTLIGVIVAAVQRMRRPEPPPVLGEVPEFSLVNRDGRAIRRQDLAGKPWIASFIFTRCPASCPMMTSRMARLNRDLGRDASELHLVSISVDPEHDTPAVLDRYAKAYEAPAYWLFLTGNGEQIFRLSKEGFKLGVNAAPQASGIPTAEPILHSTRFVLVDAEGRIRGYYDAFDEELMQRLESDLQAIR